MSYLLESLTHLAKESHSEVGAQQSLACVHDLSDFAVCTMQCVIQVGQFLLEEVEQNQKNLISFGRYL